MAKANKDGWIRHRGGKCPLSGNPVVDVRLRTGAWQRGYASCYEWSHNNQPYDIMAYSIHTATQQEPQPMTAEQIRTKYIENLASIADLHKQNATLVDDLRKMGFDFYDEPKETQEDMSDPKNWRVGDLVQCVSTRLMLDMTKGKNYEINDIDGICISLIDDAGDVATREADTRFRFHSRPTK